MWWWSFLKVKSLKSGFCRVVGHFAPVRSSGEERRLQIIREVEKGVVPGLWQNGA